MGPRFLLCHDENFYFVSNASDESEYAMQKKVNMGKSRVTSWRGSGDLSLPNRTSPLFILWVHRPIPEMVVLIFDTPLLVLPCLQ
jgi:hypothetical protein